MIKIKRKNHYTFLDKKHIGTFPVTMGNPLFGMETQRFTRPGNHFQMTVWGLVTQ